MTLKEARAYMISNPGLKFSCCYFHDEWIMFDGTRFVFEDGVSPDAYWWSKAYLFDCSWFKVDDEKEKHISENP